MKRVRPSLLQAYKAALRHHAHWLIAEGYERMDKSAFAQQHEPAITGVLVGEMRSFLESGADAPDWVSHYSIHDDPPVDFVDKQGSSRPRVDIEFERVTVGKRPRLRFEAKRLCTSTGHSVTGYLGEDGLGCFLSGKYSTTHSEAGMLGYVQSGDEKDWAEQIGSQLKRNRERHGTVPPLFARQHLHPALRHTYVSHHSGIRDATALEIHHVLLRFV
jgi:hypothetical protein